jgi:hypothetical protein
MLVEVLKMMIVDGGEHNFTSPDDGRWKGTDDWRRLGPPLLDSFNQDAHQTRAHLLDYAPDRGVAPIARFFLNAGGGFQMKSRDREGVRENGWTSRF